MEKIDQLFSQELNIINMGLEAFHKDLKNQNVNAIQMSWRPRAGGNAKMLSLLNRLKSVK